MPVATVAKRDTRVTSTVTTLPLPSPAGQFSLTVDKRQPYEFDLRVPLYLRGGGVPAGRTVRAAVSSVDLAPTLLQLAGLEPDPGMDGVSLMEVGPGSARGVLRVGGPCVVFACLMLFSEWRLRRSLPSYGL